MVIITEDPLRNYDPNKVTFGQVKGEVSQAMQQDWKRDKVDDAKKRAITDCRNYDEFKARVAGCTLKPIHRNEFNEPPKFAYNRMASSELSAKALVSSSSASAGAAGTVAARPRAAEGAACSLRSGRDFERELRRCRTAEDRVALVAQLDGPTCGRFFGRELDGEVLRQLLVALEEATGSDVGTVARRFLSALAAYCPSSTSTAASFLTPSERGLVATLLSRHADEVGDSGEEVRICAAFGVPPGPRRAAAAAAEPAVATAAAAAAEAAPPTAEPAPSAGGGHAAEEGVAENVAAGGGASIGDVAELQDQGAADTPANPDYDSMD